MFEWYDCRLKTWRVAGVLSGYKDAETWVQLGFCLLDGQYWVRKITD